jgi:hypothetical protein
MQRADVSAMRGILQQLCPRCRAGKIFRKSVWLFPGMYERCPVCGLKFEREDGYFLGAMYISYALGIGRVEVAFDQERGRGNRIVSAFGPGADLDGPNPLDIYGSGN